eukprot:COSAG02_NODE_1035_length_15053_cov_60.180019_7_plen_95_part_00
MSFFFSKHTNDPLAPVSAGAIWPPAPLRFGRHDADDGRRAGACTPTSAGTNGLLAAISHRGDAFYTLLSLGNSALFHGPPTATSLIVLTAALTA